MDRLKIETSDREQLVTFRLGHQTYGINIFKIQEVIHFQKITSIPHSPEFVEGVIQVRNQVIPVVDLKRRLGIRGEKKNRRLIVILEFDQRSLGIIVDNVSQVLMLDIANYEPLPEAVINHNHKACITRLAKCDDELIMVIDPELILSNVEKQALQDFEKNHKQREINVISSNIFAQ